MAGLRKALGVVGAFLVAIFGTLGILTQSTDPGGSRQSLAIAAVGFVLWIQFLLMGDKRFLGAVGLLLVAVVGPISIFAMLIDPAAAPPLLALTGLGLILWSLTVAAQVGLSYSVTMAWLVVFVGFAVAISGIAILVFAGLSAVFGSGPVSRAVGLLVVAFATTIIGAWARRNPRRAATLRALRRGALARATREDSRLLAAGPLALFRAEADTAADPSQASQPGSTDEARPRER